MNEFGSRIPELEEELCEINRVSSILSEVWKGPAGELCISELRKTAADTELIIAELRKIVREDKI